jgi:pimeloyl-ACP methyl ester carboxylesterase
MQEAHFRIPVNGITLAAVGLGDPAATPVVLLHGGGQTKHSWRHTAEALGSMGWYAVAVDMRGHGESDWSPDGNYGLDPFVEDVVRVVDYLGRPPVLVGASLGGCASLGALGAIPHLALGLVLVDVTPYFQPAGFTRIREFMRTNREDGFSSIEEVAGAVAEYLPYRPTPADHDGLRKNLREVSGRYFWHWDPAFLADPTDPTLQHDVLVDPVRLGAAASLLRIPTLLIRGGDSDVVSEHDAAQFLRLVPHAEFTSVAGAHHMVAGDDNAVFDEVLRDFIERRIRTRLTLLSEHPAARPRCVAQ